MAKKRAPHAAASRKLVTPERLRRWYHLLRLLADKPLRRDALAHKLKIGVRKFYRDLQGLRDLGIGIVLVKDRYLLADALDDLLARLPFPDPGLTMAEAVQLAKGKGSAHRKLRDQIKVFTE